MYFVVLEGEFEGIYYTEEEYERAMLQAERMAKGSPGRDVLFCTVKYRAHTVPPVAPRVEWLRVEPRHDCPESSSKNSTSYAEGGSYV